MSNANNGAVPRRRQNIKNQKLEFTSLSHSSSNTSSLGTVKKTTRSTRSDLSTKKMNVNRHGCLYASTPFTASGHFPTLDASVLSNVKTGSKKTLELNSRKKCNNFNEKLAEAQIDLYYGQYLQMKYLESQTKKAHESRTKCAMEKIQKVRQLVELCIRRNYRVQKDMSFLTFFLQLNKHLEKQNDLLSNFLQIVPSFEKEYISIAKAVDAVKHKLSVKDILLSDPGCEEEIIELLQNIHTFLNDFLNNMKNLSIIIESSEILHSFADDSEHITSNIKRSLDLLSEAKDLLLTETTYFLGSQK